MEINIIRNNSDCNISIEELECLMDLHPTLGTKESYRIKILSLLIRQYEKEHHSFGIPDPITAIEFIMDQRDLSRKNLKPYIGSQSKVSEVLSGKRPLSLRIMRALHEGLGIPADILLQKPKASITKEKTSIIDENLVEA